MLSLTSNQKIYYTLRIAVAMCFIGHGAFGIILKPVWCNYFGVFGIGNELAYQLMPLVGMADILFGIGIIVYPYKIIPAWLVIWGLFTALLRPLSGEHFAEFLERGGNYSVPAALLLLSGNFILVGKGLFKPLKPELQTDPDRLRDTVICLKIAVFLLLAGHGWLNLVEKKALLDQYASLGSNSPQSIAQMAGLFEIIAAFVILIRPPASLLIVLFVWKMGTELFYPQYALFEWIERGGSYGAILALWFAVRNESFYPESTTATGNIVVK